MGCPEQSEPVTLSKTIANLTREKLLMDSAPKPQAPISPLPEIPKLGEPQKVSLNVGFQPKLGTAEEEKVKIDGYYDQKYGPVEEIELNEKLLDLVEDAHQFLLTADLGPNARKHMQFLFTSVNELITDVLQLQALNNQLNTKVRDLTLEMVKSDINRASFR